MTKVINCYQAPVSRQAKSRRLNLRFFNACLGSLIAIFGVLYLVNVSDMAVKGFALKELKGQSDYLASENMSYEERVSQLQSYYSLSERTKNLGLVAVGEIDYLSAPSAALALR